jgi:segregation and condensation protein A
VSDTTPLPESDIDASSPPAEDAGTRPGEQRPPSPMDVKIEQYQGPLDLLLDLIRKQKLNIYDIPIAQITNQYLDYLRRAEKLNIDLGGEFVFMAATLIHIKSKMLLPVDPTLPEDDQEDPRNELVQQLLEHEKYMQAAQMLQQKRIVEENVWSNPPLEAFTDDEEPGLAVSIFDLVKTFEKVLERAKNRPTYEVEGEDVSVASRIEFLKNLLLGHDGTVTLQEIFERQPTRRALIATFLALLEMVRMQAIVLRQKDLFGDILVRKHKMFDVVFSEQESLFAADGEYQE